MKTQAEAVEVARQLAPPLDASSGSRLCLPAREWATMCPEDSEELVTQILRRIRRVAPSYAPAAAGATHALAAKDDPWFEFASRRTATAGACAHRPRPRRTGPERSCVRSRGVAHRDYASVLRPQAPRIQAIAHSDRTWWDFPLVVERTGIEPVTSGLQSRRSPS